MKRDKIKTGKFRNRLKMQLKDYIRNKLKLNSMTKTLKKMRQKYLKISSLKMQAF